MKNEYYHAFYIGFNYWYIAVPAFLITMAILGYRGAELVKGHEKKTAKKGIYARIASFFGLVFGLMLWVESGDGIVQWFDNHLQDTDSGVWSLIVAPCAIMLVAAAFASVCYKLATEVQYLHFCQLRRERWQISRVVRSKDLQYLNEQTDDFSRLIDDYRIYG